MSSCFFDRDSDAGVIVAEWSRRVDRFSPQPRHKKLVPRECISCAEVPRQRLRNTIDNGQAAHFADQATAFAPDHSRIIGRRERGALQDIWNGVVTAELIFCSRLTADLGDEICRGELTNASERALHKRAATCSLRISYASGWRLLEGRSSINHFSACQRSCANVGIATLKVRLVGSKRR